MCQHKLISKDRFGRPGNAVDMIEGEMGTHLCAEPKRKRVSRSSDGLQIGYGRDRGLISPFGFTLALDFQIKRRFSPL